MKDEANSKDTSQAKGKSKHVTTACKLVTPNGARFLTRSPGTNCRKKKIKCDFNRPRCSNCVLYSQDCVFPTGIDKRKIPSKDRIAALTAHAQHLEALLRQNGIPFQPILDGSPLPAMDAKEFPGEPGGIKHPKLLKRESTSETRIEESVIVDANDVWLPIEGPTNPLDSSPSSVQHSYPSPPREDEAFIDQLTGRMGSMQIAEDGQKRFYGATSNLHILHNGPMSLTRSRFSSLQKEGEILLRNRGLGQYVDRKFEDHLLKLYFCWEDPSIHVMDEELFFREREKCKATHETSYLYSEVLVNAM